MTWARGTRYALRGKMAIIGAADTRVGVVPNTTSAQLYAQAATLALADAGIGKDQVDGLITCNASTERGPIRTFHAESIAETLGIAPRMCLTGAVGGALPVLMMEHAAAAIAAGVCNTVLLISADNILSGMKRRVAVPEPWDDPQFEEPYGPTTPAMYALIARAHMHAYGTTSEQFAAVAVACRKHAALNPGAQKREPITIADVLNSRMIADPLHLLDCSLVSDGGAAIVMTAADRAKDARRRAGLLSGRRRGPSVPEHPAGPQPDRIGRGRVGQTGLRGSRCAPHRYRPGDGVRRFHLDGADLPGRPGFLRQGRGWSVRRQAAISSWAARFRSTPTAACCRIATRVWRIRFFTSPKRFVSCAANAARARWRARGWR